MEPRLRATGHHLPYGITQSYLPPDSSGYTTPQSQPDTPHLNRSQTGQYSIYIPPVGWKAELT